MTTTALLFMLLVQVSVTLVTGYFLLRVLRSRRNGRDRTPSNDNFTSL